MKQRIRRHFQSEMNDFEVIELGQILESYGVRLREIDLYGISDADSGVLSYGRSYDSFASYHAEAKSNYFKDCAEFKKDQGYELDWSGNRVFLCLNQIVIRLFGIENLYIIDYDDEDGTTEQVNAIISMIEDWDQQRLKKERA